MSDELKPGDVVRLNSGGPAMTVCAVGEDGAVYCWWATDRELHKHDFPRVMLTASEPDRPC